MIDNSSKIVLRYGVLVMALIICLLVFIVIRERSLSATITVNAVPLQSHITINSRTARQGVNHVRPGNQKVLVSMDGFTTISQSTSAKKGDQKTVNIVLTANSSATANWYLVHPDDAKAVQALSDKSVDKLRTQVLQTAPLIKLLPFVGGGLTFRVDYGNEPGPTSGDPVIYITAPTGEGQQAGIQWIQSIGFNPANYNIKYVTAAVRPLNP